jgi:hypothetical protein
MGGHIVKKHHRRKRGSRNPTMVHMPPWYGPIAGKPIAEIKMNKSTKGLDTGLFVAIVGIVLMLVIALLQWNGVVTVRWGISALGYSFLVIVSIVAFWKWEVSAMWETGRRWVSAILLTVVLAAISMLGISTQYEREHPPIAAQHKPELPKESEQPPMPQTLAEQNKRPVPPSSQSKLQTVAPRFTVLEGTSFEADDYDGTMLWEGMGVGKPTISPIGLAEYFTITNTDPRASMAMIDRIEVDLKGRKGDWIELPRVLNIGPTYFGLMRDPTHIEVAQFTDGFLFDKLNHKNLSAGEAVQGWVLLELPDDLADYPRTYRIRIKTTGSDPEYTKEFEHRRIAHAKGPSGTQVAPYGEPGSLASTSVRFDPANVDLSMFDIMRHRWPQHSGAA